MRNVVTQLIVAALLALSGANLAHADGRGSAGRDIAAPPANPAPVQHQAEPPGRTGQISLNNDQLSLSVPHGWKFYSPDEAYAFLQRNGAAAPSGAVLGLLAQDGINPREAGSWATVVSYDEIGYVQPQTASGLGDANFEQNVRDARHTQNRGFEGFAEKPTFATALPSLNWAERTGPPGVGGADLRVEEKLLGRKGVACLTTIGSADQMDTMQQANQELTPALAFTQGYRQADFAPATDQVSNYSVPGLVTGVATPAGRGQALADNTQSEAQTSFGGFAGAFPWIAGAAAVLAGIGYMLTRRRKRDDETA